MLWIVLAAMTAIVGFAIFVPFLRNRSALAEPTAAYDLRVYRDQLREIDRDLERGVISDADADRLRTEIGRKVLDANRALNAAKAQTSGPSIIWPAIALAAVVVGAFGFYHFYGAPSLPDEPIAGRLAAAEQRYASRPTQAEAEAEFAKKQTPPPPADPEYLDLINKLRTAMKERPDDPRGLALLAEHEARLGNIIAAKDAQAHLVRILGDKASADDHAHLAALMADAAGGVITRDSEAELDRALTLDRKNEEARFLAGLLQLQNGRPDRAFPIWANLLAENPDGGRWNGTVRQFMPDLAWLAGEPDYVAPEAKAAAGPNADQVAAAESMSAEDRQTMIASMVEGLEARLASQGGTPEEWARLISSLVVLGKADHARDIWLEAQSRFSSAPDAIAVINTAAKLAGITQ